MNQLLMLITLLGTSICWHPTGHFITALIAQVELQRDDPDRLSKLKAIVGVLSPFTAEKDYAFVECAEFPDDIKYQNWKAFNSWHFHDHYFFKGVKPRDIPVESANMVWAIQQSTTNLNTHHPSKIDQMLGKSFSLRYLIHLVGDIHQPLHSASMVSEEFPDGDAGGNSFKIDVPSAYDLHTYWDLCLKKYKEVRTPLTKDNFEYLNGVVNDLMEEFPREKLKDKLAVTSHEDWSLEGLELAKSVAYDSIKPGDKPSPEYIDKAFQVVRQQLALGGYRLADILKRLRVEQPSMVLSQE